MKMAKGGLLVLVVVVTFIFALNAVGADIQNMAVLNGMPTVAPDPALSSDWYDTQVVYSLYSPLVYPTPDGKIRPHLASKWWPVNDDTSHWRVTLRPGVKFHDGSEVTAEDVAFSMERCMKIGRGFSGSLGKVTSSKAISKYEVEFRLEKPNGVFPETLTVFWIVNKELVLKNKKPGKFGEFGDYAQEWLLTHDAGSGPYIMTAHKMRDRLTAVRFKDYFLGWDSFGPDTEPIENLIYMMIAEPSTLATMMKSRQVDLETHRRGIEVNAELDKTKGITIKHFPGELATIWLNTTRPPTDDVHFRRAIKHAFDYNSIAEVFDGVPGAPILAAMVGFDKQFMMRQDLDAAKAELAQSKYKDARIPVTLRCVSGSGIQERVMLQLQANLYQLGLKADFNSVPWTTVSGAVGNKKTTPNAVVFNFAPVYPSADFYLYFMYHPDRTGGVYASHWMADEELGKMLDETRRTADFDKRIALYGQIQERVTSLGLAVYAFEMPQPHPIQDYIIGPKETYPMLGPNFDMHNYRINLKRKAEILGK